MPRHRQLSVRIDDAQDKVHDLISMDMLYTDFLTTWLDLKKDSIATFTFDIADTSTTYDIVFSVTNKDDYPYANLYLFNDVIFPSKHYTRDTIEFILAAQDGEWLGTGMSGYTNDFQYKTNVRFPEKGTYTFTFEQAMRCKNEDCSVQGIESVALAVKEK